LGRCPKPRKLFEKSLTKNFDLKPKAAHLRGFTLKFLIKLFSKSLWGSGQRPENLPYLDFDLI